VGEGSVNAKEVTHSQSLRHNSQAHPLRLSAGPHFLLEGHPRLWAKAIPMWKHHRILILPMHKRKGLLRELNPGPLAPEARIIPLDQAAS
jgi:hypothetical protein